jgi:hypothetical protein
VIELPGVEGASIQGDEVLCLDADDRVVARFPTTGTVFGRVEDLHRIAAILIRRKLEEPPPSG